MKIKKGARQTENRYKLYMEDDNKSGSVRPLCYLGERERQRERLNTFTYKAHKLALAFKIPKYFSIIYLS